MPQQTTYVKDVVSSPTVNHINWAMVDCLVSMVLVSSKCFLWLVLCFSYYQVPTGKLIEEQDEESANTVVVLLASNGIYYARGLTVVLLR